MDRRFTWTQPELARFISDQLADRPEGPHCENTKIWPFCVSATGLGLKAYDAVNGTRLQSPFDAWTEFAQRHYMGRDRRGDLEWFAFYYDPIEREATTFPDHVTALAPLVALPYLYPQRPDWGQWLYEQSVRKLGWSNPKARINEFIPDPRAISIALLMAHELGDDVTEARLRAHVEEHCEPRFFGDENDRFGFFFGWGEQYPRGQQSALLMVPEVGGRGAWARWSGDANLAKFAAPTVEGVDYPSVGLSRRAQRPRPRRAADPHLRRDPLARRPRHEHARRAAPRRRRRPHHLRRRGVHRLAPRRRERDRARPDDRRPRASSCGPATTAGASRWRESTPPRRPPSSAARRLRRARRRSPRPRVAAAADVAAQRDQVPERTSRSLMASVSRVGSVVSMPRTRASRFGVT